ncbi:MAG: hypothetical protein CVV21_01155 [Candidatus Goldiibacteriota bacterium HGW-Goldbacteria-1]|jgi:hypothetical protein|nr:MAG: hypothetical protein CVV21_01155 [Candidatus Goldiibacteriota bacterium HGW-Goldbacteria-1]
MGTKKKVFGRIWEDNRFQSLFVCSCGKREWVIETEEDPKKVICNICANTHYLKKSKTGRYMVLENA